jgi:hypothetical protein
MKRSISMIVSGTVSILLVGWFAATWALSQEKDAKDSKKKADAAPAAPDMDEMMKQWMALATPGEGHKRIEVLVGNWDAKTKMWMAGPDGPSTESKGSESNKWVLGKRFILSEFKGDMVMPGADGKMMTMSFEGLGMTGYDNFRNMYISTWADTMGTQLLTMAGSADPAGKVISYYGTMDEPSLKVVGRTVRFVTKLIDNDHRVFEMYDLHAGPEYKVMQIEYTRKK